MGRKLSAKTWAIRRNPNLLCEVCGKEPAWAFGWLMVPEQAPAASDFWPVPMSAAELLALPDNLVTPKTTPYLGRLVGDCTTNLDYYDVTFQAFMTQDTPQGWIDHVGKKLWCNNLEWLAMIDRSGLLH